MERVRVHFILYLTQEINISGVQFTEDYQFKMWSGIEILE
jgi:hypothetical protein